MKRLSARWVLVAVILAGGAGVAAAQTTYTWAPDGVEDASGTWDAASPNWLPGQIAWPNNASPADKARFGLVTATRTVVVSGTIHLDALLFSDLRAGWGQDWVFDGGTLDFVGSGLIDPADDQNAVRINSVVSGSVGLTLDSSGNRNSNGEIRLAGNNTYSGVTRIYDSTLAAYHRNALGATGAGNHTEIFTTGRLMLGGLNGGATAITLSEDVVIKTDPGNMAAIRSSNANNVLEGNVENQSADAGLNVNTAHTFTMKGNITSGGGNNRRVSLSASGGPNSKLVVNGSITDGRGGEVTAVLIDGSSKVGNSGVVELAGDNRFSGGITLRRGTLRLSSATAMGTNSAAAGIFLADGGLGESGQTLSLLIHGPYTVSRYVQINSAAGANTYTAVIGGSSAHASAFQSQVSLNDANDGTYQLSAADGGTVTFHGLINDGERTKALTKIGPGTVVLARADGNTFDGGMTVAQGTLLVKNTNGSATGSGAVTVNDGATLGGTGRIGGHATVHGTLAPGALIFDSGLTLDGTATSVFELNGKDATAGGGGNDLVIVNGDLTLAGTLHVSETTARSFLSTKAGNAWRLFNYTGRLTDKGIKLGKLPDLPSGFEFQLDTATAGQVNLKVVASGQPSR